MVNFNQMTSNTLFMTQNTLFVTQNIIFVNQIAQNVLFTAFMATFEKS